jgi:hypothetical protein
VPATQGQDIPINDAATLDYQGGLQYEVDTSKGPSGAYPDYSKGPSALDKAGQLFFFTEILRGKQSWARAYGMGDEGREVLDKMEQYFSGTT